MAIHLQGEWVPRLPRLRTPTAWRVSGEGSAALFGPLCASALLVGVTAGLLLPALPSPFWLVALMLVGLALLARGGRARLLGVLLFGVGFAGLHADHVLRAQLPASLERRSLEIRGRIAELPIHEPRRTRFEFVVDDAPSQPEALRGNSSSATMW